MTILAVAQICAKELSITSPSSFIGSADNNMILLQAMIEKAVSDIKDDFPWPELVSEYTFTLSTGVDSYPLPGDAERKLNETLWNRTQKWPLIGPMSSIQWQQYKSGIVATYPRQRFRVKGWKTNQFYIDPTPSASENGQTIVYEYMTQNAFRPKTWAPSTSWAGIRYCSYNGNIYDRGGTGAATTGTSAPVHTSGSASDGSVTWAYLLQPYNLSHDTDEIILDNAMIKDGAVWRFKMERGLEYQELKKIAEDQLEITKAKLSGGGVISMNRRTSSPLPIGLYSYPEANF